MKEFGSDFHYLNPQKAPNKTIRDFFPNAYYYALGRQALVDLYKKMDWKRLWIPEYFCYEVISYMICKGVNLEFYQDYPLANDRDLFLTLPFKKGDALLRVNYYGLRSWRSNKGIPVPVVEDHTHDLIGNWATKSDADWCIASLRKSMPLAEGGILWSPKGMVLHVGPNLTEENVILSDLRWSAMRKKTLYLNNMLADKKEFRNDMLLTEKRLGVMGISSIDNETKYYIKRFDIIRWYKRKRENWEILKDTQFSHMVVVEPEDIDCYPFSLTLLFNNRTERDDCRLSLINSSIYPAILWSIPDNKCFEVKDFSERMLSIHCDARYNVESILKLRSIIAGC